MTPEQLVALLALVADFKRVMDSQAQQITELRAALERATRADEGGGPTEDLA